MKEKPMKYEPFSDEEIENLRADNGTCLLLHGHYLEKPGNYSGEDEVFQDGAFAALRELRLIATIDMLKAKLDPNVIECNDACAKCGDKRRWKANNECVMCAVPWKPGDAIGGIGD